MTGGHSGAEIHKGLGNSNKILFEIIASINTIFQIKIVDINGGGLRNAIPRESSLTLSFSKSHLDEFNDYIKKSSIKYSSKFVKTDPNFNLESENLDIIVPSLSYLDTVDLINSVNQCPNGVNPFDCIQALPSSTTEWSRSACSTERHHCTIDGLHA